MIESSVAQRKISPRKRGSKIVRIVDPFRYREILAESGLEEDHAYILIASPRVDEIREQQAVEIVEDGITRDRFLDQWARWDCGSRVAYEVKYHEDVARSGVLDRLRRMADQVGDRMADSYRLLTERDIDAVSIANAKDIVDCGSDLDLEGRELVREHLRRRGPKVRLGDMGRDTRLGTRGYRAAISLIQDGSLVLRPGDRIGPETVLDNALSATDPVSA